MSIAWTTSQIAPSARLVAKQHTSPTAAGGTGCVAAPALGRALAHVRALPGAVPAKPARARGALRAVCRARPESASQRVYTAVRALQPLLAQDASQPVRALANSLVPVLEEYRNYEDLLAGGQSTRVALEVGFKAVAALEVILMILQSLEEKRARLPLRPVRRALVERREELRSLNWRSRLELCMRAEPAAKE